MMELDSQSMTPPSSPIIGYSGNDDERSLIDSGVVYCLNCKGAPRANDFSFSPEGYILRREVISAVDSLRAGYTNRTGDKPKLFRCFGYLFDPLDQKQIRNMILICRKSISSLEILSESSHSFNGLQNYDVSLASDDPDDLSNQSPWVLRRNVCQFLNIIVKGLKYYRTVWRTEELSEIFLGLKKSLFPIKSWSSVLRTHCGFRSGNECSSATYHFFHLQLELRWSLFLIFGATLSITNWLLEELIQLAKHKYTDENGVPLDEKRPFNCMCIKEIWTMVRLVVEHLDPERSKEKPFWNLYTEAMQRVPSSDPYFSLWLTSSLAQISDFSVSGAHRPGHGRTDSKENGNNANQFVHGLFKEWVNRGGKSAEVLKLSFNFFQYWGGDCDMLIALWTQWVPRLDRGNEVTSFDSYSNIDNWIKLISQLCESGAELCGSFDDDNENIVEARPSWSSKGTSNSSQSRHLASNKDPFMEFVCLVAAYARWAKEKDIRKLKSNICMKLTRGNCNTNDYGEIGIIRVSSLFMALSTVIEFEREAVSMCERLQDIFSYGKGRNTPARRKAILRAYSCMIIVLLKKKISLTCYPSVASSYMKTIDELLCQATSDPSRKDLVMIYIDLLDSLPKHTPNTLCSRLHLGRHTLISSNLSMWFTNAGHNYVLRTARSLSETTECIVKWTMDPNVFIDPNSGSEGRDMFDKISEKSLSFMKSVVILNANRVPSTDVEPLACLAADVTLLTQKFKRSAEEYEALFDLFALNERTCPLVSQYFIQRLCKNREFIKIFSLVKLTQTWIRLLALDCSVPDELTEIVLQNGFSSTSNRDLLREFCRQSDKYDRDSIQNFLAPLVGLLKGVMSATLFKDDPGQRDVTSVANQLLETLAPAAWPSPIPPWEKFSLTVMKGLEENLYEVFKAVALYPGATAQDLFLRRKLQDILVLAFFGFIRGPENVDRDKHPAIKILDLSEEKNIKLVQDQILPHVIAGDQIVNDLKLCQLFLNAVNIFVNKRLATQVMRVLSGIIRAYLIHCNSKDKQNMITRCVSAVIYCCLIGSSNSPFHKKLVTEGFKVAFEKEFLHRGRNVFQLCVTIVESRTPTNGKLDAKRFIKLEIIPLLKLWVEKCEQRRGIGFDKSLREPLRKLEFETANVPV